MEILLPATEGKKKSLRDSAEYYIIAFYNKTFVTCVWAREGNLLLWNIPLWEKQCLTLFPLIRTLFLTSYCNVKILVVFL